MREIKAYVSRTKIDPVIEALQRAKVWATEACSERGLAAYLIEGALSPLDGSSSSFSLECGNGTLSPSRLELHCEEAHVQVLVQRLRDAAATEVLTSEWIFLGTVVRIVPLEVA